MGKYQPKNARKVQRGNEYTQDIWFFAKCLGAVTTAMFMRYGVWHVTPQVWGDLARMVLTWGIATITYAVIFAVFTMWNVERQKRNTARFIAERRGRRS